MTVAGFEQEAFGAAVAIDARHFEQCESIKATSTADAHAGFRLWIRPASALEIRCPGISHLCQPLSRG